MNGWKYLKDHWLFLVSWLFFILLTSFILWLSPTTNFDFSTMSYLFLLSGLFLGVFLVIGYSLKIRWWKVFDTKEQPPSLQEYLTIATKEEEKIIQAYINDLLLEYQQTMQQFINNQQEQKEYIDTWVHEIKVPLSAVMLILQSVEEEIPEKKYYQLENELKKIEEYVEQVLYYARLDNFSKDYLVQEYSLKTIVQSVVRNQMNYFIQKNIQFSIIGEDQMVLTDTKWVTFIFQQLLSNALKYTPNAGKIIVEIDHKHSGICLSLKDTGIGIPIEDQRRIFDKGFTGKNGRLGKQHSTGLGLYLAKNLAEKLGHQLTVESTVGEGTTMKLFFPFLSYFGEDRKNF
ncbi:HAMP domain-containing sensor histidine kinase [Melissococcus plutonius]|uniref:histidine kinase n=1 Tax=Melissococcus plutonius TaxID=33970 RepID=A0A2Z5Y369_9ENTE|nr:HAMP domain-containing sensor histidine kinase [Melissococcus plutonius]BAL62436.1 sensor histidine kinase [Melissococcus plutonius DAT561]MCV2499106.1 HAMP domain-containing histidine kinase [Melissococcus plutonius]MCV2500304.1 HAMP domain-containing histidine kinase [Melissococcus plutonius]MCV2504242.1 HAMP domain-containing histidine kinase [Melissococcus plutonius]MCV2507521.1 HAMP domain-containing histidine kinase [Melissococcus plutonius]